jgi:hypothetical protein
MLTRLRGGQALRTDSIDGQCDNFPTEGEQFEIMSSALDEQIRNAGGFRLVRTSQVDEIGLIEIVGECLDWSFKTRTGSVYRVRIWQEGSA